MNVAFQVRRRPETEPASAALFAGRDPAPLLGLCARLGLDPGGRVYDVCDGLLLKLGAPTDRPLPGALRLRALAPDLLLPVDGELTPSLLDDEAQGLTRDRGLVFLPDGRVLAFDRGRPIPLAALLTARVLPRREWAPLPVSPALAERIESILVEFPEESPDATLDAGTGGAVGADAVDPAASGPEARNPGTSGLLRIWNSATSFLKGGAGKGRTGGANGGAEPPPPDAEMIARQEAALRGLIREFREGDVEKALRRALPMVDPGESRGAGVHGGDRLPDRDLNYRLDDLLGAEGGEAKGGRWPGGGDLIASLRREYRKAAEGATRRGDHRRAAAIYGKLLRDNRSAAQSLLRGGLYHDAGVLLLARLDDRRGAARAFAAAGEADRAVELYREVGDHEAAGDLLRAVGEEEAAVAEYRTAAGRLASSESGHLAAGNLLLGKAGRVDLAIPLFAEGWRRRPSANAVPCAVRLSRLLAEGGDLAAFRSLLDEADVYFAASPSPTEPGQFYNEVATLSDRPGLVQAREELRDRALMGLAAQLRSRARSGDKAMAFVPSLLGASGLWPAAVVSDASHAVAAATRPRLPGRPMSSGASCKLRVCAGSVSAVAGAAETGEVFMGTDQGEVWALRPASSEVIAVASHDLPVAALAVDPGGGHLVVLRSHPAGRGAISSYARQPDGRYTLLTGTTMAVTSSPWLTPVLRNEIESLVGFWDGESFHVLSVASITSWGSFPLPAVDAPTPAALLLESEDGDAGEFTVLTHDGRQWCLVDPWGDNLRPTGLHWRPEPQGGPLRSIPLSWSVTAGGGVELAGLGADGVLHWARLRTGEPAAWITARGTADRGFLAAAIVREGLVAAVSPSRVEWLRCGEGKFLPWRVTPRPIPSAVAAFASRPTGELIVVVRDGHVVRLSVPA